RSLDLSNNQIRNIILLEDKGSGLYGLGLDRNQIIDIKPLANFPNLVYLSLNYNQIKDVKPISVLTKLEVLRISHNQINDIKSLASLANLDVLVLIGNPINEKICPAKQFLVCIFQD
ncbi:MAG: leucine-rich repeat domain-containing protein, partial [Pseudanabaena sp.]